MGSLLSTRRKRGMNKVSLHLLVFNAFIAMFLLLCTLDLDAPHIPKNDAEGPPVAGGDGLPPSKEGAACGDSQGDIFCVL